MARSPLHPSKAATWLHCPASHLIAACFPSESGQAANDGTEAHKYAARLLANDRSIQVGVIPPELVRVAEWYVNVLQLDAGEAHVHVEQRVSCDAVHESISGTPDAYFIDDHAVHIYDLKTGFQPVEAFENWQLMTYAAGICERMNDASPVEFIIAQRWPYSPAGYRGDRWQTTVGALRPYWDRLRDAAEAALGNHPQTHTGEHCRYCNGRHACQAAHDAAASAVDMVGSPIPIDTDDPDVLGYELTVLTAAERVIKNRRTGLEAAAYAMTTRGQRVPGWALQPGRGSTTWKTETPVAELVALGEAFGVDMRAVGLTPKQAIAAGIPEGIVEGLSETTAGNYRLAPVSAKDARKAFGQ